MSDIKRKHLYRAVYQHEETGVITQARGIEVGKMMPHIPRFDCIAVNLATGIKDCEGRDLYEGDLVKWPNFDEVEVVIWDPEELCFCSKEVDGHSESWLDPSCERVGNIYENPISEEQAPATA